jgi:hypothetical protein
MQIVESWLRCAHTRSHLVNRPDIRGNTRFQHQCLACGSSVGNFIAVAEVVRMTPIDRVPMWDSTLEQAGERAESDARSQEWDQKRAAYQEYLKSQAWKEKRALIHRRAKGVCEGCGQATPTQVHHLTYEHVGREFLWELVAVCDACHELAHGEHEQ